VDAGYGLRAATRTLDSDFVYTRHLVDGRYTADFLGDNHITLRAGVGTMSGRAPLYERFTVGDTERVRGWNKFDIDPLGGSRTAWGSVEYRYDHFLVFYDVGSVWDRKEARVARHGVGAGFGAAGWFLAVAFPLRSNGVQPVFMLGTTF
jgi:outer membrane protein assembly factor BamA